MTQNAMRWAGPMVAVIAGVVLVAASISLLVDGDDPAPAPPASDAGSGPASQQGFAALSRATTNRCDLRAAELREMPNTMRLQGSCCFPMDQARYEQQRRDLRRFREERIIPRDPYNVSVAMVKRLLTYRDLALDREQRAAYERATELSELGGPCCCPCWRWQAFKGQAHFMLARRDWSAAEVARLWDLEEGCGGPGEQA